MGAVMNLSKLPLLIGPRFKRIRAENDDREKLARAHMRRAKGPKNHSTNKERSQAARVKAAASKKIIAARSAKLKKLKAAISAYWRGEREDYPT
jgi:hypothetical protein